MKTSLFLLPLLAACCLAGQAPPAAANTAFLIAADLRSFFHGEPAPPPKAPPPKQLAAVRTAPGVEADPQIESFFRALADALKARDGKAMQPRLAERYAIDDLPDGFKPSTYFAQAIDAIASPSEIVVSSIVREKTECVAVVELHYGTDPVKKKIFRFDAGGKLVWTDWFRVQVQRGGA
ncbi:MAG: hypothetical protein HY255_10760 [Betaproteobacteria bacterium]|nr:hypothetical protein [Betaproteobacteria bacterium]